MIEQLNKIKEYSGSLGLFDYQRVAKAFEYAGELYAETDVADFGFGLKVVDKLIEFRPDEDTLIAIVLYDLFVLEFIKEEKVLADFGEDVLTILNHLKKLSSLHYAEYNKNSQAEVLRKMFLTMAKDIRVVIIWLAARLCQLEDFGERDDAVAMRVAKETMHIYVPIAARLGIYRLKIQLEDLAFKYLDRVDYENIKAQIDRFSDQRKNAIGYMVQTIERFLIARGMDVSVSGRIKNIYSIYRKLKRKNLDDVSQLFDFFAIRVVLKAEHVDENLIYTVLGLMHGEWKPISNRFKDYVAVPKPNGYRSLHTVLLGLAPKDADQPVEIQIRDMSMHREAEYGIASHWLYKDKKSSNREVNSAHVDWINGLEQLDEIFAEGDEFLSGINIELFKDRIFVLTPRGDVKDLPAGSTPVDFAYSVHTDVGHQCVLAKVNGVAVPLVHELKNGDVVEIVVRKDATPKLEWLSKVKSNFARSRIKAWFSAMNRDHNVKEGRRLLNAQLERLGKPILDHNCSILKKLDNETYNMADRESLLEEIGRGVKLASNIVKKVYPYEKVLTAVKVNEGADTVVTEDLEKMVMVGDQDDMPVKLASCCKPVFGNPIIAYVTRGNRVSIHRANCRLLDSLDSARILIANWKGMSTVNASFKVGLNVRAVSRVGLLRDITTVFSDKGIFIADISLKKRSAGIADNYFLVELNNLHIFDELADKLESVPGVLKVTRVDDFEPGDS